METSGQFEFFTSLPTEIQMMIWKLAIENCDGLTAPRVYTYKPGCWQTQPAIGDGNHPYRPGNNHLKQLDFQEALLRKPKNTIVIGSVSHQARTAALRWISKANCKKRAVSCSFTLPFRDDIDVLFVPEDQWKDFNNDPPKLLRKCAPITLRPSFIRRLAVPQDVFLRQVPQDLRRILKYFPCMDELLIVVDKTGCYPPADGDGRDIQPNGVRVLLGRYGFKWSHKEGNFQPAGYPMMKAVDIARLVGASLETIRHTMIEERRTPPVIPEIALAGGEVSPRTSLNVRCAMLGPDSCRFI